MKYGVDRIEGSIAILESLEEKNKIEIPITSLPSNIKEGTILIYDNGIFTRDLSLEEQRRKSIKNKFDMLKQNKSG